MTFLPINGSLATTCEGKASISSTVSLLWSFCCCFSFGTEPGMMERTRTQGMSLTGRACIIRQTERANVTDTHGRDKRAE